MSVLPPYERLAVSLLKPLQNNVACQRCYMVYHGSHPLPGIPWHTVENVGWITCRPCRQKESP